MNMPCCQKQCRFFVLGRSPSAGEAGMINATMSARPLLIHQFTPQVYVSESVNKLLVSDILQRAWITSRGTKVQTCLLLIGRSVER